MLNKPVLLADIGATNARLAFTLDGKDYVNPKEYKIKEFRSLHDLCSHYIKNLSEGVPIAKAIIGVAAPVTKDLVSFVNIDFTFSQKKIKKDLFPNGLVVLNDLALQAHSLGGLPSEGMINIGGFVNPGEGSKILVIPGTGLGLAGIVNEYVVSSEAGHLEIPSIQDNKDIGEVIDVFKIEHARIPTFEDLLSGKGLNFFYSYLSGGKYFNKSDGDIFLSNDKYAKAASSLFIYLFAVYLRYMTLIWGATGGVYISGNIVDSMMMGLDKIAFRKIFEDSKTMREILISSPIFYIKTKDLGFRGGLIIAGK
jgi:glucokinase